MELDSTFWPALLSFCAFALALTLYFGMNKSSDRSPEESVPNKVAKYKGRDDERHDP